MAAAGLAEDRTLHEAVPEAAPTEADDARVLLAAAGVEGVGTTGIAITGMRDEATGVFVEALAESQLGQIVSVT